MVRHTPELVQQSMQYLNPCRGREICLRGYQIPRIENLGATLDQFDAIDLLNNNIRKLDEFLLLKRLNTLVLNLNPVVRKNEQKPKNYLKVKQVENCGKLLLKKSKFVPGEGLPEPRKPSAQRSEKMRKIRGKNVVI